MGTVDHHITLVTAPASPPVTSSMTAASTITPSAIHHVRTVSDVFWSKIIQLFLFKIFYTN